MSTQDRGKYRSRHAPEVRWQVVGERLQAVSRSALVYFLMVLLGLGFLLLGIWMEADLRDQAISRADRAAFAGLAIGTVASVVIGQLLAVFRIREWVLVGFCVAWYGIFGGMEGEANDFREEEIPGMVLAVLSYLGPLFILCGSWSLRVGRALLAAWLPLMLAAGGAVLVAQASEKIPAWEEGDKWQVWEPLTLTGLGLMVVLVIVFLAARERQSLKMWQRSNHAHLPGASSGSMAAGPRLSALGWGLMIFLGLGVAAGTATTAPFLWVIDPAEEGYGSQEGEPQRKADYEDVGDRGDLRGEGGGGAPPPLVPPPNHSPLFLLIMLSLLLLLALLFGYRPVKRLLTIQHLRRPYWHLDATHRVTQSWRLVEIALGDAGIRPRPGEPASKLLERAYPILSRVHPVASDIQGLRDAALIRDRVSYGLGLGPDDERVMIQVSSWAYDTIWESLGDSSQLRAMYRGLG